MQQHEVQRGMIVILHIKVHRQIIEAVILPHGQVVAEPLCVYPHRLRVHIGPILQELAVPSVLHHILYRVRQIPQGLPKGVPPDLLPDELREPPLRLGGHNPGIELGIG